MKWLQEFKTFAVRGNVVDMAVGLVVGAAFGKIVSSFVADVIMPPIGLLVGGKTFTNLAIPLKQAKIDEAGKTIAPAVTLNYGNFIQTIIDFTIVAFAIFLVIKAINTLKRKEAVKPSEPPLPSAEVVLLTDIRDILRKG
ncbi:MAG: large-conductance mechanosensitive channel protein MscL [Sedimentisphaerales bacterium]